MRIYNAIFNVDKQPAYLFILLTFALHLILKKNWLLPTLYYCI